MKRRDALTTIAAAPLAAFAFPAQGKETKKESATSNTSEVSARTASAPANATLEKSVDLVELTIQKQMMSMGPAMYTGTIEATVTVPVSSTQDWTLMMVTACVYRGSDKVAGPIPLTKDAFSGKYVNSTPVNLLGCIAGNLLIARVVAAYQVNCRGESQEETLP